jgi:hypothetical protein
VSADTLNSRGFYTTPEKRERDFPKIGELWKFIGSTGCLVMIQEIDMVSENSNKQIKYLRFPENDIHLQKNGGLTGSVSLDSLFEYAVKVSEGK